MFKTGKEKRRTPRVPINLRVKVEGAHGTSFGTGRDLSEGGIGIYLEKIPPVGSQIILTFNLPSTSKTPPITIKVTGEVKYHAKTNLGRWVGVRFLRMDTLHQKFIHDYVAERYQKPLPPPIPKIPK